MITYSTKVDNTTWIRNYLMLWSTGLELTDSEFELIYEFVIEYFNLKNTISSDSQVFEVLFSTKCRNKIRTKLDISVSLFNNRISALKSKGVIIVKEDVLQLAKNIIPVKEVCFKFYVEDGNK
jgi:hypothetical protein